MEKERRFGMLISCSSNAVMRSEKVKELIDRLAAMGYDFLELCTDDTYKIDGEPYFGYFRGGYTKEEIRAMDEYARAKGIELIPCIQTLAHLVNLVKLPHYADIVDINDILLAGDEKTYRLIDRMFANLRESYSTNKVNIGMDEAHMIGLGRYLDKNGYRKREEILLEHVIRVAEIAEKYGFSVHMWSDMFFRLVNGGKYYSKTPEISMEILSRLPENVALTYWDYYSADEEMYEAMFSAHKSSGREVWFAGGAWNWAGFAPFNAASRALMKKAMRQVIKNGIENVIVTTWGDDGQECPYTAVLPSLYAIRRYADGVEDEKVIAEEFYNLFGVSFADFNLLDLPNKTERNPEVLDIENPCKLFLYSDPFVGIKDDALAKIAPIPYGEYADVLYKAAERAKEFSPLFENLANLCRALEKKAYLGIVTRRAYKERNEKLLEAIISDYRETAKRIGVFRNSFRRQWMTLYKPYGWEIQEIRLGGVAARLEDCAERIEEYISGKAESIPELEEEILPYEEWDGLLNNSYRRIVSVSEL